MDNSIQSLEKSFWNSGIGRVIGRWLEPYKDHRDAILICALLFIIGFPFLCIKSIDRKHVDKGIGYEIQGPPFWHMSVSPDLMHVQYEKRRYKPSGNAVIRMDIDIGNPYGSTMDYLVSLVIPRAGTLHQQAGSSIRLGEPPPYALDYRGREWATGKFYVNERDVQIFYVTILDEYVLMLSLYSPIKDQVRNEKLLNKTLKSFVTHKVERRNKILEKFDGQH